MDAGLGLAIGLIIVGCFFLGMITEREYKKEKEKEDKFEEFKKFVGKEFEIVYQSLDELEAKEDWETKKKK